MHDQNHNASEQFVNSGDIVKGIYKLVHQIGTGSFGCVFEAIRIGTSLSSSSNRVAIKFDRSPSQLSTLFNETYALRAVTGKAHFPRVFQYGTHNNSKFIVLELLGPDVIDIANRKRPCQFSIVSTLKFGIQGIEALSTLHRAGFVHRDIKP
ncbi:MAG: hypothetical protein EZS28_039850, partial [Streblomastix strix]